MTHWVSLIEARTKMEYEAAAALFREYAEQLGVDLCFQGFEAELGSLPRMYGAPDGGLWIARAGEQMLGCVGVRRFSEVDCEMKRLYVPSAARGTGLGRRLAQTAIDGARALGYQRMLLDTLEGMDAAQGLYESLGFRAIPAYYNNPTPGVRFLALDLVA
jgi:ribosomal protein S18 acetylase RimI-like enzyme